MRNLSLLCKLGFLRINIRRFLFLYLFPYGQVSIIYMMWSLKTLLRPWERNNVNFWNDLWCSPRCLSFITGVPYSNRLKLSSKVYKAWNGRFWSLPSTLPNILEFQVWRILLFLKRRMFLIGCMWSSHFKSKVFSPFFPLLETFVIGVILFGHLPFPLLKPWFYGNSFTIGCLMI